MSGTGTPTNSLVSTGYIIPSAPFVNPKNGIITPVWWRFLIALLTRTGGTAGIVTDDIELLTLLESIQTDEPADCCVQYAGEDVILSPLAIEAVALAVQRLLDTQPEMPIADALTAMYDAPPEFPGVDDLLARLAMVDDDRAANPFSGKTGAVGTIPWGAGTTAANGTIVLSEYWTQYFHITKAYWSNGGGGSITANVRIGGVSVTGLDAININGTSNASASAANAVVPGSVIDVVFTAVSGTVGDGAAITVIGTYD